MCVIAGIRKHLIASHKGKQGNTGENEVPARAAPGASGKARGRTGPSSYVLTCTGVMPCRAQGIAEARELAWLAVEIPCQDGRGGTFKQVIVQDSTEQGVRALPERWVAPAISPTVHIVCNDCAARANGDKRFDHPTQREGLLEVWGQGGHDRMGPRHADSSGHACTRGSSLWI